MRWEARSPNVTSGNKNFIFDLSRFPAPKLDLAPESLWYYDIRGVIGKYV